MPPESDEHLVRYLLGELSEAETEALDERSITDDALALRLREIREPTWSTATPAAGPLMWQSSGFSACLRRHLTCSRYGSPRPCTR